MYNIIIFFLIWNICGAILAFGTIMTESNGLNYVNPIWIRKNYHSDNFSITLTCILYNLIFPIGSFCYWIYKLCTVRRR